MSLASSSGQTDAVLAEQAEPILSQQTLPSSTQALPARRSTQLIQQGSQISLNGRLLQGFWSQRQAGEDANQMSIGISDAGLMRLLGADLLDTQEVDAQPVQWFSQSLLPTWFTGQYRYLDIQELANQGNWQVQPDGDILRLSSPTGRILEIRQGRQPWGQRFVIELDQPIPWQADVLTSPKPVALTSQRSLSLSKRPQRLQGQELVITLDAVADPALVQRFRPIPTPLLPGIAPSNSLVTLETSRNQTQIRLNLPQNLNPQISTLSNPARLVIDLRPDAWIERDILWAPGVRWQQKILNLGSSRFPVVWLTLNLQQPGLKLEPIWGSPGTLVGITPLIQMAQQWQVAGAINGGFFNRNNKLPLGAIRRQGRWISSPILNRGAIAWNDTGEVIMGRLSLQQTLITSGGQRLPVLSLNSGYVQAGLARYTSDWGRTYTPITANEIIVTVQDNQVIGQQPGGEVGKALFLIPSNGYLLVARSNRAAAIALPMGTDVQIQSASVPSDFDNYPQAIGAGPLLIQNRRIVLDARAEQFSKAFINETAVRSAIGSQDGGTLLIATVQNRLGGVGPTLAEVAQIMQQLGAVNALNLDGGSSTTLHLGGQLLNRSPRTAARVHNGIGIFIQPRP
ncbi:MAG: phosphodiester glycosidase family protein [Leptolyngbyaceae bacterium]|nr:phosphodiester glycosidase family protein [Leptolyngbyaceae bacterium]